MIRISCSDSHATSATFAAESTRSASVHRPVAAVAALQISIGAAANSFASTPMAATRPAAATRSFSRSHTRNGPIAYIRGSDVNGSNSV